MENIDFLYIYWKITSFIFLFHYASLDLNFMLLYKDHVKPNPMQSEQAIRSSADFGACPKVILFLLKCESVCKDRQTFVIFCVFINRMQNIYKFLLLVNLKALFTFLLNFSFFRLTHFSKFWKSNWPKNELYTIFEHSKLLA